MPGDDRLLYAALGAVVMAAVLLLPVPATMAEHPVSARIVADGARNMTLGVDVAPQTISFGTVPAQAVRAQRVVHVGQQHAGGAILHLTAAGNISPFVAVSPDRLRVPAGGTANATVTLRPADASPGTYTGTLLVTRRVLLYEAIT